jgi:hypothetical protein
VSAAVPHGAPGVVRALEAVTAGFSGEGCILPELRPTRSRLAGDTVREPTAWVVPVISTEAAPRLFSRHLPSGTTHCVIWDERYAHYLARLIEALQASCAGASDGTCDGAMIVRCFAAIGWDYVLEQLYPRNRLMLRATKPAQARRVLARVYARRAAAQAADAALSAQLTHSPAMTAPPVQQLLSMLYSFCRQLILDHEAYHYLRRNAALWNAAGGPTLPEAERSVLDLLAGWRIVITTGAQPTARAWPFLARMLQQLPLNLVPDFHGTPLGEEILSDLVPLMLMCSEAKDVTGEGISEAQEFKVLATTYQASQMYAVATVFLQGLRLEVARAVGMELRNPGFAETDLGLRVMLSNFLAYELLCRPPYASPEVKDTELDPAFVADIAALGDAAAVFPRFMTDGPDHVRRKHRALFLDRYERSNQFWLHLLNTAGLEIADALAEAQAPDGPVPAVPGADALLTLTGFAPEWRRRDRS